MDYQVVLPPELELSPEELVSEWNQDKNCSEAADARSDPERSKYDETVVAVLGVVAGSLATSALYDLLKGVVIRLLAKKQVKRSIQVTKFEKDGASLLVVSIEES